MPKDEEPIPIERTKLYRLIANGSKTALKLAWSHALTLDPHCLQRRSNVDQSTYLHHIVNCAPDVYQKYGHLKHVVPLIYRVALKGLLVNAQNNHGSTALHLALIKPNAVELCPHLIRIGRQGA